MKRLNVILTAIILFTITLNALSQEHNLERDFQNDREKIRIISYNVFNGFNNMKDTDRINRLVEWVKQKDPEIVALQELCGFKQTDLENLAKRYNHPYAIIIKENGYPVGITSKKPIKLEARLLDGFWHGSLHAQTYGLNMILVHLSPSDWKYRLREAKQICSYIESEKLDNCVVLGDFNAPSPFDADLKNSRHQYATISTFLATSLEDICRMYVTPTKRTTFPTRILSGCEKNEDFHKNRGQRIDYILVSQSMLKNCIEGMIWNGPDTDYLSDHYPIGIDLFIYKK